MIAKLLLDGKSIFAYNECFQNKVTESKIVKLWIITVGTPYRIYVIYVYLATIWIPPMEVSKAHLNHCKAMGVFERRGKKW